MVEDSVESAPAPDAASTLWDTPDPALSAPGDASSGLGLEAAVAAPGTPSILEQVALVELGDDHATPITPSPAHPLQDFSVDCWSFLDTIDVTEEFKTNVPTFRYVPGGARVALAQASEQICNAVLRAREGSMDEERA